jgi:hypothetical protein
MVAQKHYERIQMMLFEITERLDVIIIVYGALALSLQSKPEVYEVYSIYACFLDQLV